VVEIRVTITATCPPDRSLSLGFIRSVLFVQGTFQFGYVAWELSDGSELIVDETLESYEGIVCILRCC
jgi:hypothetical protein